MTGKEKRDRKKMVACMETFLDCMALAKKSGGLYCGGVVTR